MKTIQVKIPFLILIIFTSIVLGVGIGVLAQSGGEGVWNGGTSNWIIDDGDDGWGVDDGEDSDSSGGVIGSGDCVYNGKTYKNGDGFDSDDGCNICSCSDGRVQCTLRACRDDQ